MQYKKTNTQNKLTNLVITTSSSVKNASSKHLKLPKLTRKSQLNKIITTANGSPDYLAINIFWDTLRSWYVPNRLKVSNGSVIEVKKLKTKGIFINYNKLVELYGCSKDTIRARLVKLEKLGLIQRSFQHKQTVTTKSYNQMIIYVWKNNPHFSSDYGILKDDILELKPQTNHKYITEKFNIEYEFKHKAIKAKKKKKDILIDPDTKQLIEPFNKLKGRSVAQVRASNFDSDIMKEKKEETQEATKSSKIKKNTQVTNQTPNPDLPAIKKDKIKTVASVKTTSIKTKIRNFFFSKPKELTDFHPIPANDCSKLRSDSGREFTDNAINEILLDMSKRVRDRSFRSKKGFMAYMAKVLTYEMRDAVKTSDTNFKIKANLTDEDKEIRKQEKFLSDIEYSLEVSPEWHLKKKLSAVLERSKAYQLLLHYQRLERKGKIFKIYLRYFVKISEMDKQIILNQIRATHDRLGSDGNIECIEKVEFIYQTNTSFQKQTAQRKLNKHQEFSESLANITNKEEINNLPIWLQIRKGFIDNYFNKTDGINMDKYWLAKIIASLDGAETKANGMQRLILKTENNFIRDWINSNFLDKLEEIAKTLGYKISLNGETKLS